MTDEISYNVEIKNGAKWRQFPRIRLMISVGQKYHEGNKLRAVVDWINRNPCIKEVHTNVCDFLQRHNYYGLGHSKEKAGAIALLEGSLWIERNEEILSGIKVKNLITRWTDWYGTEAYKAARAALEEYKMRTPAFAEAIEDDICSIRARKEKRGEAVAVSFEAHCREYLQEELSVFSLQMKELPAADAYPGSVLHSAEYLFGKELPEALSQISKRHFTRIGFSRRIEHAPRKVENASSELFIA